MSERKSSGESYIERKYVSYSGIMARQLAASMKVSASNRIESYEKWHEMAAENQPGIESS